MDYSKILEDLGKSNQGSEAALIIRLVPVGEGHLVQHLVSTPLRDLEVPPATRKLLTTIEKEGVFVFSKDAFGCCIYSGVPLSRYKFNGDGDPPDAAAPEAPL